MLNFKLYENVAQAKSFLRQNDIPETDSLYQLVRTIFKGKEGYIGWVTKIVYKTNLPKENNKYLSIDSYNNSLNVLNLVEQQLTNIIDTYLSKKEVIAKLKKPVIEYDTFEQMIDAFIIAETKLKAKRIYDQFPSEQKALINMDGKIEVDLLKDLYNKENHDMFIKKISAYHDRESLFDRMTAFINGMSDDNYDEKIKYLEKNRLEIVHQSEKNDIIIARIENYDQCAKVGAESSWCIARDKTTFDSYVKNELYKQYIIYLTDKPTTDKQSIIGVTFDIGGYNTAHYKDDSYLNKVDLESLLKQRKVDIRKLKTKKKDVNTWNIKYITPYKLFQIGFTKEEILSKKSNDDLTKTDILDLVKMGFSKDEMKEYYNFRDSLKYIKEAGFTEEEMKELVPNLKERNIKEFIEAKISKKLTKKYINFDKFQPKALMEIFTKEEVLKTKQVYKKEDLNSFSDAQIKQYDLKNKTLLDGESILLDHLKEYVKSGEIYKIINRIITGTMPLDKLIDAGLKLKDLQKVDDMADKLHYNDSGFYKKYLTTPKEEMEYGDYRFGNIFSTRDNDKFNLGSTIRRLKLYEVTQDDLSLSQLEYVLDGISKYEIVDVINCIKNLGYTYTDKEIKKFIKRIINTYVDEDEIYEYGIDVGIDYYPEMIEYYTKYGGVINNYKFETAKKHLSKKYPEEWKKIAEKQERNIFVKHTLGKAKYWSKQLSQQDNFGNWLDERRDYALNLDWKNEMDYKDGYRTYVATIINFALSDDWESLYKLPQFNWGENIKSNEDERYLSYLVRNIVGAHSTNWKPTFIETEKLTKTQIRKVYTWIMNYVWPNIEHKEQHEPELQLAYYLLDKKRWVDYLQRTKKKKMNYYRETRWWISIKDNTTKINKKRITYRFYNIRQVVKFLCNDEQYNKSPYYKSIPKLNQDLEQLLADFTDGLTMGKAEAEATRQGLRFNFWSKDNNRNEFVDKLFEKYFPQLFNESIITNYSRFICNLKNKNFKNIKL